MKIRLIDEDTRIAVEEYLNRLMHGTVVVEAIRPYNEKEGASGSCCIEADIAIGRDEDEGEGEE